MKPYRWRHPMSILAATDYAYDYPANSAYIQEKHISNKYGRSLNVNDYPTATSYVVSHHGHHSFYWLWCSRPIFITNLAVRLGITDPYR